MGFNSGFKGLSSKTRRMEAVVIPIKKMARRGTTCLNPTLIKRGLDLDDDNFQVSPLSFFSTPVVIIDRKLEAQHVRITSMLGVGTGCLFLVLTTEICNCTATYSNIYIQQDATLHSLFYLETALHVSGGTSTHH